MAAPVSPAISAWLSLVGMPNAHAPIAHITIAVIAAHRAIIAESVSPPKFTMFLIVMATFELTSDMIRTPRKLQAAAIIIALSTSMHLVDTHVAMAFGASVHPFTRITPSVRRTAIKSAGWLTTCSAKYENVIFSSMSISSCLVWP